MLEIFFGILQEGVIFSVMALGVYIALNILDFPDLTADGSFPLGMAVTTVCLLTGINPFLALFLSFLAGALAGVVTGFLNVKLKITSLLSGIITMTALYSINYTIVGKPNEFLQVNTNTIYSVLTKDMGNFIYSNRYLLVTIVLVIIVKLILDLYLRTKSGFLLRSTGDNPQLVVTLGKNPGTTKILGLAIGNGLIALSGSMNMQYIKAFNVSAGTGTLVMGLAAVILGTTLFKKVKFINATTSVVLGMIIYKACISLAMQAGLPSQLTNLVISLLFVITLIVSKGGLKKC